MLWIEQDTVVLLDQDGVVHVCLYICLELVIV